MKSFSALALVAGLIVCQLWTSLFSQTGAVPQLQSVSPVTSVAGAHPSMQVVSTTLPSGVQQLILVDIQNHAMAVYHVSHQDGGIQLKSVRQLSSDLAMEEFNGTSPLPSELRQLR